MLSHDESVGIEFDIVCGRRCRSHPAFRPRTHPGASDMSDLSAASCSIRCSVAMRPAASSSTPIKFAFSPFELAVDQHIWRFMFVDAART